MINIKSSTSEQRLVSLTNIPTPYRIHFYNSLASVLASHEIQLEAFFMAETEAGRRWTFDRSAWAFQYKIAPGLHPVVSQRVFHFNPSYIWDLAVRPPTWLLMSGSWFLPTVVLSLLFSRMRHTKALFWSESNLTYIEHTSGLANHVRSWIMNGFDGFVVPGQWAEEYVLAYSSTAQHKPILNLPNVVDERIFRDGVAGLMSGVGELLVRYGLSTTPKPILLTAARLDPIKGIKELISVLCQTSLHQRLTLLVAGEGRLRVELETIVAEAGAQDTIRLLGHQNEKQMMELLAMADGFILPSLGDPYPLAVIEAAFARLPLVLSNRIGCYPEVLIPGRNGDLFDPHDPMSIAQCIERFLEADQSGWAAMGANSLQIAEARFATKPVLTRFVDQLLAL